MRPPISTADLLRAFEVLQPSNGEEKSAIAQVLGLEWKPAAALVQRVPQAEGTERQEKSASEKARIVPVSPPQKSVPVTQPSGKDLGFKVSGPMKHDAGSPLWVKPKPSGQFESAPAPPAQLEVPPLFVPRWTRGIMSTALAVRTPTGQMDIREVVNEIARGRLLRMLPRLSAPAIAQSVEILVDVGHSMLPFAADQQSVVESVRTVAGFDRVSVLKFTGSPLRGAGTDEMLEWPDYYSFPSSKTHVLLLSDLGIGRPPMSDNSASVEEWRQFSWELRRRQVACTVFIPYPGKRWPTALMYQFRLVEWDRSTTAGNVRFSRRPKNT
jgi:hypothetical protein